MSKRAEQAAKKAYVHFTAENIDDVFKAQYFFQEGYERAEKDIIHMVKTWLSEIHRVCDITDENGYRIELRNLIASFEKTLKEEE